MKTFNEFLNENSKEKDIYIWNPYGNEDTNWKNFFNENFKTLKKAEIELKYAKKLDKTLDFRIVKIKSMNLGHIDTFQVQYYKS